MTGRIVEALKDALDIFHPEPGDPHPAPEWEARARAALAEAEAQPVQGPVAKITAITPNGGEVEWLAHQGEPIDLGQELYAAPPQPVPLTDEQIDTIPFDGFTHPSVRPWSEAECLRHFARAAIAEFCRINGIGDKP